MTIAIGLICADGVVIAADTQESGALTKNQAHKIAVSLIDGGVIAFAGAGEAQTLDGLSCHVRDSAAKAQKSEIVSVINDSFLAFYKQHIVPLYPFHERFVSPDVDAIIGISVGTQSVLLANHRTALRRCDHFVSVGIGRDFSDVLLARLFPHGLKLPTERAVLLAAYVIYQVRESVEGCGLGTQLYLLRTGQAATLWDWDQDEMDKHFKSYITSEMILVHHLLGREGTTADILPAIESARVGLAKAVSDLRVVAFPSAPAPPKPRQSRGGRKVR
jgi:hypothetical protein